MSDITLNDTPWRVSHKGDVACRKLADRHYTRGNPGHPMWTRPGYNYVLAADGAVFVWWRPKWEHGTPGTARKDGLRALECTIFRRENQALPRASELITAAVDALGWPEAESALRLAQAGVIEHLITGVGSKQTARGRSARSLAGACFRAAGWTEFAHRPGRADVWLRFPWPEALVAQRVEAVAQGMSEPQDPIHGGPVDGNATAARGVLVRRRFR